MCDRPLSGGSVAHNIVDPLQHRLKSGIIIRKRMRIGRCGTCAQAQTQAIDKYKQDSDRLSSLATDKHVVKR